MEEVEDSPDFWSRPVQSYYSPVEHRFLIGLDRSTNGPLPDYDHKYVSVRTMPPGLEFKLFDEKQLKLFYLNSCSCFMIILSHVCFIIFNMTHMLQTSCNQGLMQIISQTWSISF